MKKDFTYCKGNGCAIRESCFRYREGLHVPKDVSGFWWMEDCGEQRPAYTKMS